MEFVNGLVVVANSHDDGLFIGGELLEDVELGRVGVLEFVEADILVAFF